MGKRARRREAGPAATADRAKGTAKAVKAAAPVPVEPRARAGRGAERADAATGRRRGGRPELPPAPWHPFPLVELCVLVGLVILVVGFVVGDSRGGALMVIGALLAALAGADTAVREHFGGVKSHSTLLASMPAVLAGGAAFYAVASTPVVLAAMVLVFALVFPLVRRAFIRRAGVALR